MREGQVGVVFWQRLFLAGMLAASFGAPAFHSAAAERVIARNNVPIISGGIGEDAIARLKARENEFNLKLVFTLIEGNYVADVGVSVIDATGKTLVDHVTDGPILMARLPAGVYTVIARYNGMTQTRKVTVRAARLQTEYMRWPSNLQVDFPGPVDGRSGQALQRPAPAKEALAQPAGTASGIVVISGGIGEESQAQLKLRESEFNLKLVFTLIEGNYVSDVGVEVKSASGVTVISQVSEGPFLLARLPAGAYTVTAAYEGGQIQTRKIAVGSQGLRTEYFRWKSNPQTDTVLPPER